MNLFSIIIRDIKNIAHFFLAILAVFLYANPSKKIKVIGVTGTDGKTTTCSFIYHLLKMSGKNVALISTVGVFMGDKRESLGFHVTTPSPFAVNKYIKKAVSEKMEYIVIEVSSHALDQYRVHGIDFEIGTITNITKEHLDYHRTMQRYLEAKVRLLKMSRKVILNVDDSYFSEIKKKIAGKKISTFSLENNKSDLKYSSIKNNYTQSLASYNRKNLMTAILTLDLLGVDRKDYSKSLNELKLPEGRMEIVKEEPFKVIIDFAHTPNAYKVLLPEIKKKDGRLIHVFGSAGKRDKEKRPALGSLSSKFSDVIILTAEDPRSEKVEDINNDIRKGISEDFKEVTQNDFNKNDKGKYVLEVNDRRKAIQLAINIAKKNDTVVITGKGPEESMNMGHGEIPWNDIKITKELISKNG